MNTVPYQKTVIIHKERPESNFIQISNEHWMEFNKAYGPYALQVYLYLAKNADGFNLALSQVAAENDAGIKRTTFHKYIDLLIREGYLVQRSGNTYDFYETPREQKDIEKNAPPNSEKTCAWDGQNDPYNGINGSQSELDLPPFNKEIDKRYTDNKDIIKDKEKEKQEEVHEKGDRSKEKPEFYF